MLTQRFTSDLLQPANGSPSAAKSNVRLPALVNWAKGTVLGFLTGTGSPLNERHTLTFGGTLTGGTVILQWNGTQYQTAAIPYNATPATMVANLKAALDALFGVGNTTVGGTGPFTVDYTGDLANKYIPKPTVLNMLTGTTPTLTVAEAVVGHPGSGLAVPYDNTANDGREVARVLLIAATKTDIAGQIIGNTYGSQKTTAEVFISGTYYVSDLPSSGPGSLDATAVGQLGRLINATSLTATGAKLQMK